VASPNISIAVSYFNYESIYLPYEIFAHAQSLGMHNIGVWFFSDGKEHAFKSHEILALKMRPKSLQDLCCNAIITATIGLPERIDQLPLPASQKIYLQTMLHSVEQYNRLHACIFFRPQK